MQNQLSDYQALTSSFDALLSGEKHLISVLSNTAAFLNSNISSLSWVGFYLVKGKTLILGPFQGGVACSWIEYGKGVCGDAWQQDKTILVDDVSQYDGYIACDAITQSEIVIPVKVNGKVYAVLDIDSVELARFSVDDQKGLESLVSVLQNHLERINVSEIQ